VTKNLNKMKDLRVIYQKYVPKIINEKKMKYSLSEESIFGNLNYNFNRKLFKANINNFSSLKDLNHKQKIKLIPIVRNKKN